MINSFKDFDLNQKQGLVVKKFFSQKKMTHLWEYVDSLNLPLSNGKEVEVICGHKNVSVRVWN